MKVGAGDGRPDLISFDKVLYQLGKLNEAEEYYLRHLNQQLSSSDDCNIANCYYALENVIHD